MRASPRWLHASALVVLVAASSLARGAAPKSDAPPATAEEAARQLADVDRQRGEIEARAPRLSADASETERRCYARARAYAKMARVGLLAITGGFEDFVSHTQRVEMARRALLHDVDALRALRTEIADAGASRVALTARHNTLDAQLRSLEGARAVAAEEQERKMAFDRAFTSSRAPSDYVAVYGPGVTVHDDAPVAAVSFASLRGRLPLPVSGRVEARAARRESAQGPGLELDAPRGAGVRAVAAGRVAFSAEYGDYGRMVILDHGDRYFTVIAGLGDVEARVGDELSAGARVGSAGSGPVYFEVRHGTETLPPKVWLGLLTPPNLPLRGTYPSADKAFRGRTRLR